MEGVPNPIGRGRLCATKRQAIVLFVVFCTGVAWLASRRGFDAFKIRAARYYGGDGEYDLSLVDQQAEEMEDQAIMEKEKRAGKDCTSLRSRHPGMINSMPVQFVHIPKTGGSSIQLAINEWAEENPRVKVFMMNSPDFQMSSFTCPPRALEHSVLIGHRGWGFCRKIERNRKGLFTVAALRDSVSRMVSLYDYNLQKLQTERSKRLFVADVNGTVDRFTLSKLVKKYNATTNVIEPGEMLLRYSGSQQTRFMCGYECLGPNAQQNATITEEFMLKRALEHLHRTTCVGITEKLHDLLVQLKYHLKWIPYQATMFPRQNKLRSEFKSQLDEESEAILRKWAWTDDILYREAKIIAERESTRAKRCYAKVHG